MQTRWGTVLMRFSYAEDFQFRFMRFPIDVCLRANAIKQTERQTVCQTLSSLSGEIRGNRDGIDGIHPDGCCPDSILATAHKLKKQYLHRVNALKTV